MTQSQSQSWSRSRSRSRSRTSEVEWPAATSTFQLASVPSINLCRTPTTRKATVRCCSPIVAHQLSHGIRPPIQSLHVDHLQFIASPILAARTCPEATRKPMPRWPPPQRPPPPRPPLLPLPPPPPLKPPPPPPSPSPRPHSLINLPTRHQLPPPSGALLALDLNRPLPGQVLDVLQPPQEKARS